MPNKGGVQRGSEATGDNLRMDQAHGNRLLGKLPLPVFEG